MRKSPQQRFAEIKAAAGDIALAEGLHHVTIRGIASRAGITPGLVTHYVPSMDELRADTFAALVHAELLELEAEVAQADRPIDALRTLIRTLFDPDRDPITGVWLDAWSLGRHVPAIADAVRQEMDSWQNFVVELIDRGRDSGEFTADDSDAAAWHLIGTADGLNAHSLVRYRDPASRSGLLARSMEHDLGLPAGALQARADTGEER
ncbi:TetR family transcriptional regulator C-terminal domain-containing protein [Nocardiopsis salina]|uniref:TetR family transcriptional regulator C-terminal domain-containing protein n=1 Tax=Nocardiopsis salina TaxID=245836 RepID=UPI00034DDB69|nr:TetR family transcriptional regulator C-terminal domain-containing protein [Nocardiopsis salina]